ncbi:uracil-DNA glycosylase family protein [Candidatus Solincola tengchongensis]|uniref:uracil-DNA glycosylase family protein n=1 Tax=Candidatus Solincola tengchongensis TaxID=2900693 RepID=UPI00257D1C40|nr:uracil-DNA glycosylase family protein [Candidatus Solincola tengchongensis]
MAEGGNGEREALRESVRLKVQADLDALREAVSRCSLCPGLGKGIPGRGSPGADILFLAGKPGPGASPEDPWGGWKETARKSLALVSGLSRCAMYFSTALRCAPEKVTLAQLRRCAPYLAEEILLVGPRVVVVSGKVAAVALRIALGDEVPENPRAGDVIALYGSRFLFQVDVARLESEPWVQNVFWKIMEKVPPLLG